MEKLFTLIFILSVGFVNAQDNWDTPHPSPAKAYAEAKAEEKKLDSLYTLLTMTKLQRLEIENELMREYRLWYNPANISNDELIANISTQKDIVKMLEEAFQGKKEEEESAKVLLSEVMKMFIWEDILTNRDPNSRPINLDS